jgi:PAS domain S-box-containing protein
MKVLIQRLEAGLGRLSPLTITAIALCATLAISVIDYFTPGPASFVLAYMLVVVFAAWGAGKWAGLLVSGVAVIAMFTVVWVFRQGVPQSGWVAVWNNSTRFLAFGLASWLTAEMTKLTRNLGSLVEERTAQWKAEAEAHKATAARLTDAVERFEQLVGNINEVFWLSNVAKTEIAYISPAYERVWGRKCEELYREPASWVSTLHPADREAIKRRSVTDQAGGGYDVEYRIVRPDGAMRWIRDRAFPVRNAQGEVYRIAGIAEDITERKQAEQTK